VNSEKADERIEDRFKSLQFSSLMAVGLFGMYFFGTQTPDKNAELERLFELLGQVLGWEKKRRDRLKIGVVT